MRIEVQELVMVMVVVDAATAVFAVAVVAVPLLLLQLKGECAAGGQKSAPDLSPVRRSLAAVGAVFPQSSLGTPSSSP